MMTESHIKKDVDALCACIDGFPKTNILVVGDIIMDKYVWGHVSRISPEAPVPVVEVKKETMRLGGAANVLNNITSLGGHAILCGVVGDDRSGRKIVEQIRGMGLPVDGIIRTTDRPTSVKSRVVAHNQQVVRFDKESRKSIHGDDVRKILEFAESAMGEIDAVIVADYGKGVISSPLMDGLRSLAKKSEKILAVDPKTGNFDLYTGAYVITPNHHEAGDYCRLEIEDEASLLRAGKKMLEGLESRSVLITQGKDGMTLFERDGEITHIKTIARKVYDVSGAGDTVIGALCMGLSSGMDLKSAALISNYAAGIVVGEFGTSTVTAEELRKTIEDRLE
jgi:D-beta-D-heptose 7-phosphate kinase/D-beta-D-heptose 1-phosphate adenosyltransferase